MDRTLPLLVLLMLGCEPDYNSSTMSTVSFSTFQNEVDFLRAHGDVHLLSSPTGGRVALSAVYQGRVMTSAVAEDGFSIGWINRPFIEAGSSGTVFDNYGGEDRLWLGPEAGQFGLYFTEGADFNLDNWQVPHSMQEGAWTVSSASDTSVTFTHEMQVDNYGGETFDLAVERTVRLLNAAEVGSLLQRPTDGLKWVAYESINRITNAGSTEWSEDRGLVSIWILGMMNTFGTSWVVVPFDGPREAINDAYFGRIPADRLAVRDGYALFKADGNHRSKLGIPAAHAESVVGSYSHEADILTIIDFDIPEDASRYVNSMWEIQDDPYGGDVVNSFNDGPPGVGGFYELESSSPALALKPGESYTHRHRTIHVSGDTAALDSLSETVLRVRASEIGI